MHSSDPAAIGRRINSSRLARQLSVHGFASLIDVSEADLERLEKGQFGPPGFELLRRISTALGTPLSELLGNARPDEAHEDDDQSWTQFLSALPESLLAVVTRERLNESEASRSLARSLAALRPTIPDTATIDDWDRAYRALLAALYPDWRGRGNST
jgi:transcriptional regulator with XRE-family HTH domain